MTESRNRSLEQLEAGIAVGEGESYLISETRRLVRVNPGDLLKQVMEVDESFWVKRTDLRIRLVAALERALGRVRKTRTPTELERELRVGLTRHQTALRTT